MFSLRCIRPHPDGDAARAEPERQQPTPAPKDKEEDAQGQHSDGPLEILAPGHPRREADEPGAARCLRFPQAPNGAAASRPKAVGVGTLSDQDQGTIAASGEVAELPGAAAFDEHTREGADEQPHKDNEHED